MSTSLRDTDTYAVNILVGAYVRHGLLREVTTALTSEGINIVALHTQNVERHQSVQIRRALQVSDLEYLSQVFDRVT